MRAAINLQKLAKQREEKLSVAEYELRIAREDLAELQRVRISTALLMLILFTCTRNDSPWHGALNVVFHAV